MKGLDEQETVDYGPSSGGPSRAGGHHVANPQRTSGSMKRKTVSLCMIARDEEATIGMTIKSVLALVDEIIVVDTGSRDNTRIIAEGYGARVVVLPWQDDFAAARNAALMEASGDWILVLDADEQLQPVRPVEFQRLLHERHAAGYRLQMISPRNEKIVQTFNLVRLFRNHPRVRYVYPIHEQVLPSLNAWAADEQMAVLDAPLSIMHEGYRQEKRAQKRERNLRILRRALAAQPDEPYFAYQLACESLLLLDDEVLPVAGLAVAVEQLEKAWRRVVSQAEAAACLIPYATDLAAKFAAALLAAGEPARARSELRRARKIFGEHPALLLQSVAADCQILRDGDETEEPAARADLLRRARHDIDHLRQPPLESGFTAYDTRCHELYPWRYLGELALLEGRVSEAAELFEKALTVDESYSFAWLGLAECARFAGDRKRALKLYLRTVTADEWNHRAWLRGCSLMEELEFHDNADSWRRKVAVQFPEHPEVLACSPVEPTLLAVPPDAS
jgi:glycosyltransferase involved in cell wall biosynthesis